MYSVKQLSEVAASRRPVLDKHFYAATKQSGDSLLHFSYRLLDLQQEIEKRTFYLGKYRKTEEAAHLMDLIGMSRDEGDLLYPFAQEAMANVYDQLTLSTQHIAKRYEWKEPSEPILVNGLPVLKRIYPSTDVVLHEVSQDNKSVVIYSNEYINLYVQDDIGIGDEKNTYDIIIKIGINYKTFSKVIETDTMLHLDKSYECYIPKENIIINSVERDSTSENSNTYIYKCSIIPFRIQLPLEKQSNITSSEEILDITETTLFKGGEKSNIILKNPTQLPSGTIIVTRDNVNYEIIKDTNENDLVLDTDAIKVDKSEIMTEGIHYYFATPNYLNLTAIAPLDNAIKEALVNRIIWKWLVLSYPAEAAVYDTLYQDSLKSIALRCNIFNKHWQQVPRIL